MLTRITRFTATKIILHLLAIGVFGWLLWLLVRTSIDIKRVVELLAAFPTDVLIIVLLLSTLIMLIRSWRFYLLLRWIDIPISFWGATKVFIAKEL